MDFLIQNDAVTLRFPSRPYVQERRAWLVDRRVEEVYTLIMLTLLHIMSIDLLLFLIVRFLRRLFLTMTLVFVLHFSRSLVFPLLLFDGRLSFFLFSFFGLNHV